MESILNFDFKNCFILVLSCFSLFSFFKKLKYGSNLPPSPPSLPLIGHLHLLFSDLAHKSLLKISSKYGPLVHLRIFNVPILLVSSSSMAYEIFRTNDVKVSSRGAPGINECVVFASSGFFNAPYVDELKFLKKFVATKFLGPKALALEWSRGVREVELHRFYRKLFDKAMKKESFGIFEESVRFVNNIFCKMSMGGSFLEENKDAEIVFEMCREFTAMQNKLAMTQLLHEPFKKLAILLFKRQIMDLSNRVDALVERNFAEREEKLDKYLGNDLMSIMLAACRDENEEFKITRDHIKSAFSEICIANPDSSSSTIQWTMAEIINNPNVFKKLREEIESVVGTTRLIQETDLPNLPYLQAVMKEGLRLHPYMPILVRKFTEGCKVGDFYIPKNTILSVNAYAVMRDPDNWKDPNEFKPERFLTSLMSSEEEEKKEKTLKYLSFGSGRRGCPGSNLGYSLVGTAIGMMVQCFDWEVKEDKVNMEEAKGKISMTMASPLMCTPLLRTLNPLPSNLHIPSL